jgi:hypothetical protein
MAPFDQERYDNDAVRAVDRFECAVGLRPDQGMQDRLQAPPSRESRRGSDTP